jgi:hypothetical protein
MCFRSKDVIACAIWAAAAAAYVSTAAATTHQSLNMCKLK